MPLLPETRRLVDKLIREVSRSETKAIDHPARETKRIGDVPPVLALREVAAHASLMRRRLEHVLHANEIAVHRSGFGSSHTTFRQVVIDRVVDAERSFRTSLADLRHGYDVVQSLREVSRNEELFGLIRWCDDWLGARRPLVARVEAQLGWFGKHEGAELMFAPPISHPPDEDYTVEEFETPGSIEHAEERPGLREHP